jgi:hypothetical protein
MTSTTPEFLYHYTSQQAFVAIVETHHLWATDILFLNDATEFIYAVNLALKILSSYSEADQKRIKPALEQLKDGPSWGTYDSTYLVSFSKEEDLLSQWRAYCPASGGVSISFHADELQNLSGVSRLVECEYDQSRQEDRLRPILDTALKDSDDARARAQCAKDLIRVAPEFKDPSFREEKEWRLLIDSMDLNNPAVRYRPGPSMFVPYVALDIASPSGRLPLDHLILGPTPNPDLAWLSAWRYVKSLHLRSLIQSRGFFPNFVRNSAIPFRPW